MYSVQEIKGGASENFSTSNKLGEMGEKRIKDFLVKSGYHFLLKTPGKNSDFDLKFLKKIYNEKLNDLNIVNKFNGVNSHEINLELHITTEIKTDFYGTEENPDRGNMAVEKAQYPWVILKYHLV